MIGAKLAHYEITTHIGSGGMGDVYQATDTKLGRSVAIKFLPEAFSHDTERVARFQREARVLASLNHSNIAAIHGIEESGERKFLVMELVDGETLGKRIMRGPIPVDESLGIAKQICEALEAAHEKGIIHRDLKPANVKITQNGKVKVLDFGLAKAFENEPADAALSNSPTLSMAATNAGMILGTAAYMSPEQAKGRTVDKRTDIFAFGCVFYEMLTGRAAFEGEDVQDILGSILKSEPDWTRLPADTPLPIRRLLGRCLQKDRNRRFKEAGDVRIEIEEARTEPFSPAVMPAASRTRERIAWVLSVAFLIATAVLAFVHFREAPLEQPRVQFDVPPPGKSTNAIFEISPDGRYLAIVGFEGDRRQLWIRALDSGESRIMPGTEGSSFPFWSPDSGYVGFFAGRKLKKIAVSGASPQILCDTGDGGETGGTWNQDGTILFGGSPAGGALMRVSAAGGIPVAVTKPSAGDAHNFPSFLSGDSRFLFTIKSKPENSGVYVGSLDGMSPVRLLPDLSSAAFVSKGSGRDGYLLFRRGTTLMAQPFDPIQLKLLGEMIPLAEQVNSNQNVAYGNFSVSRTGTLVFRSGATGLLQEPVWMDRAGRRMSAAGKPGLITDMALSPDENRVALTISDPQAGNSDVWLLDVARGAMSRFTFGPGLITSPVWSADGSRIAFSSRVSLFRDLYQRPVSGSGQQELLIHTTSGNGTFHDWSNDGKFAVYSQDDEKTKRDLWLLPMDGDHKSIPFLQSPFNEDGGQFSSDGRWLAYSSDESGQNQVYVRPISPSGPPVQVSTAGGTKPRWRRDGRELFYLSISDNKLMAVPMKLGTSVEPGTPQGLFEIPPADYQPAADGQRFLVLAPAAEGVPAPITVVLNWRSGLKK